MTDPSGWSSEAAAQYLRMADVLVPARRNVVSVVADLATAFVDDDCRVLDLGCGSGEVTAAILRRKPRASALLVDASAEMIRLARDRFRNNPNVRVVRHDLDNGVPGGIEPGDFHSVVSCFATHHVDPERRVNLYLGVRRALRRDGVFVNGDRFVGEAPAVHEWEHESWVRWMATRIRDKLDREVTPGEVGETQAETDDRLQDRPGTVWDMRKDMLEAGFRYVDCLLKTRVIAVLAASGSAAPSPSLS